MNNFRTNHKIKFYGTLLTTLLITSCSRIGLLTLNVIARSKSHFEVSKNIAYANHDRGQLDVYTPKGDTKKHQVIIFYHGGNWSFGSKGDYVFIAEALTSRGFVVVVPNYRQYPKVLFPEFVADGAEAVAWTHKNIQKYGGDPKQIFIMGHSSGAHIAAMVFLDPHYLKAVGGTRNWIRGFIGLSGPYDFLPLKEDYLKTIFGPPERYPETQPINFVDGKAPPALLLHGLADTTVKPKNTINLTAKIESKGGSATAIYYKDLGHIGMVTKMAAPLRKKATILDDISQFILNTTQISNHH